MEMPTPSHSTDILVVLSNELIRHGVRDMLRWTGRIGSVLSSPSPRDAMPLLERGPGVLVTEADERVGELVDLAAGQGTKVLLILDRVDAVSVERAAALPADGLLVQSDLSVDMLDKAVRRVLGGEFSVPTSLGRYLMAGGGRDAPSPPDRTIRLTLREKEVMSLLVDGLGNKQIARTLAISEHGVKRHVTNLLAKLNCPNRTLAVVRALQSGLV
jgi:DNA-binding NarL/FixJ family response regulator